MAKAGWDHGPQSIWFEGVDSGEFGDQVPSVATIGRILAESGVTKTNPRKRPRSAWMRFSRSYPMEMWQLDGLEYRLFDQDGTKATIYQLLDDGTRFDVGSLCFERPENSEDAISTLRAAFDEYGVPQELLTDNGLSFNQARRGKISSTEIFLAERGCRGITGRIWHPETQGLSRAFRYPELAAKSPCCIGFLEAFLGITQRDYADSPCSHSQEVRKK
ncbi:hypothetical protein BLJ79_08480 [Arthrobacter sp. UCD-GKA]|nr:hypothetical protein BLJ79_08480 [Arthrobacter sp. UCD-GKA]